MISELERLVASMIPYKVTIGRPKTGETLPYVVIWGEPDTDTYPTQDGEIVLQCWAELKSATDAMADSLESLFNCVVLESENYRYHTTKTLRSFTDDESLGQAKLTELTIGFRAYQKG